MSWFAPLTAQEIDQLVAWRRALHAEPELSMVEWDTQRQLLGTLAGFGLEAVPLGGSGVAARVGAGRSDRVLLLRADMDALPIEEASGLEFASRRPGAMHACGHDTHMACLLAVAQRLAAHSQHIEGTIILAFQPGEEEGKGALRMIADGLLDGSWSGGGGLRVQAALGLHVWSRLATGIISAVPGPVMATVDEFHTVVTGRGGHGALPHQTRDAVVAGAAIVQALQTVASRQVDPMDPVVVTVGSIHGGSAFNVVAEQCELRGTVRSFSRDLAERLPQLVPERCAQAAGAYGSTAQTSYQRNTIALHNDPAVTQLVCDVAPGTAGFGGLDQQMRMMGGEDFAYFAQQVPACFFFVGCGGEGGQGEPHHSPRFVVDERALPVGAEVMLRAAARYMGQL